jgi:hypothetical protein
MPNDATILEYAKKLCREDGFDWEIEWKMPLPGGATPSLKPIIDEKGRQKYIERAQELLT